MTQHHEAEPKALHDRTITTSESDRAALLSEALLQTLKGFQADVLQRLDSMERAIQENSRQLRVLEDLVRRPPG